MSISEKRIVMPGDKIGIIEQYLPGEGTYDDMGEIKSSVLGIVKINKRKKIISVKADAKPTLLKPRDMIYGQITDIKSQRVTVNIDSLRNNKRSLALPYTGSIHISKAKKGFINEITDAFRIGDIIQAEVIKVIGDSVELSTVKPECGVIKAMCTRCRNHMYKLPKRNEVKCSKCNKKEKRKLSKYYIRN